jgi:hypothetical protein
MPVVVVPVIVPPMFAVNVIDANLVSAAKCLAIVVPKCARHAGVTVFLAVVYVWRTMVSKVLSGSLNAVVEAATLDFLKFRGRRFPGLGPTLTLVSRRWALR